MDVKAAANLSLVPKGGQIAPFILLAFSAIFFGVAVWLSIDGKPYILPLLGAVVFFVVGCLFWWVSHRNEALQRSHAFEMSVGGGKNAVVISADPRSLPALDYLKDILSHYSAIFHREPLPEASGIVGKDGVPVLGSSEQAKDITRKANLQAQQQADNMARQLVETQNSAELGSFSPIVSQKAE
ncbi:hypothetical protein [Pseudomonas sp. LT1P18]|uniref:hypothetical protein n=1 Tax=Pseudomonas arabinosi TaxID=3398357 RepID=UPI0039EF344B